MQKLCNDLAEIYRLDIKSAVPLRDGIMLNTSCGRKVLRKSVLSVERLLFVHSVKEYLHAKGFQSLDRYVCTPDGTPYAVCEDGTYTVSGLADGNELNLDNRDEVSGAATLLAEMHHGSKGFRAPGGCIPRDELGKIPWYFEKRLEDIRKLSKTARRDMGRFDCMFLSYADGFYDTGREAYRILSGSGYEGLVKDARENGMICHHDYTHQNVIVGLGGMTVINFEGCCHELKVYDLANFIRRKMRKCRWDIREAVSIIDSYRKVEPLGADDMCVMKAMLLFPQKFWRVVNRYYNSRRSWSERTFLMRLEEVIEEKVWHGRFMADFDRLF